MSEQNKEITGQKDANLAADTRPIPSQAEGDRATVEADLEEKDQASEGAAKGKAGGQS